MHENTHVISRLRSGETITVEGVDWVKDDSPFRPGDWYIAQRNGGPRLLTFKAYGYWHRDWRKRGIYEAPTPEHNGHHASMVIPEGTGYPFNVGECVKVREAS